VGREVHGIFLSIRHLPQKSDDPADQPVTIACE